MAYSSIAIALPAGPKRLAIDTGNRGEARRGRMCWAQQSQRTRQSYVSIGDVPVLVTSPTKEPSSNKKGPSSHQSLQDPRLAPLMHQVRMRESIRTTRTILAVRRKRNTLESIFQIGAARRRLGPRVRRAAGHGQRPAIARRAMSV